MTLQQDYTLKEVATALGMSERWLRERVKNGAEHMRFGHKIMFTAEQVEQLRSQHTRAPVAQSVTTGRGRRAS